MVKTTTHMHLKCVPRDVYVLIRNEQLHLGLFKQKDLNREYVVYEMLREWYYQKNLINELSGRLLQCETELNQEKEKK